MATVAAPCERAPGLGYVLPPGEYQLVASVWHADGTPVSLLTPALPIVITAP